MFQLVFFRAKSIFLVLKTTRVKTWKLFSFNLVYRGPLVPSFWSQLRITVFSIAVVVSVKFLKPTIDGENFVYIKFCLVNFRPVLFSSLEHTYLLMDTYNTLCIIHVLKIFVELKFRRKLNEIYKMSFIGQLRV